MQGIRHKVFYILFGYSKLNLFPAALGDDVLLGKQLGTSRFYTVFDFSLRQVGITPVGVVSVTHINYYGFRGQKYEKTHNPSVQANRFSIRSTFFPSRHS